MSLNLSWVYGYKGRRCRNNIHVDIEERLVYFVARVCIIQDLKKKEQSFYRLHSNDIFCLCRNSSGTVFASGQGGSEDTQVHIWDVKTLKPISILTNFGHKAGVSVVQFSSDDKMLLTTGLDESQTLIIWDWQRSKIIAKVQTCTYPEKVLQAAFHPSWSQTIVTCGLRHMSFWALKGNCLLNTSLSSATLMDNRWKTMTILCCAFGSGGITFTGSLSGSIYLWRKQNLEGEIENAHQAGVHCMEQIPMGYMTGGTDSKIKLWDEAFNLIKTISLQNDSVTDLHMRALCLSGNTIYIGTDLSEIIEVFIDGPKKPSCIIVEAHGQGELWALATNPKDPIFATGGDDLVVRLWDSHNHKMINKCSVEQWVRSLDFNHDGSMLAAGLANATVIIFKTKDLSEILRLHDRNRPIHVLKFSPTSQYLAVGCNDGGIDVYQVSQRFKRIGKGEVCCSYVTHIDWTVDAKFIQVNSGEGERCLVKIPSCKKVDVSGKQPPHDWFSWTCVVGNNVNAIWPKYTKYDQINTLHANLGKSILANGDDFGLVNLYPYPCFEKSSKRSKYKGHSAHVTCVRWMNDDLTLISIGGNDQAVFQWTLTEAGEDLSQSTDDNGGEEDLDSDIEKEKQPGRYTRVIAKDVATSALRRIARQECKEEGKKRSQPPNASLVLQHVFGYRGYDCHSNIGLTQSGELVFHVAAVGIVQNASNQRFYTKHTDDILCLNMHPLRDLAATGQVGKQASIHIWDTTTMNPVSILKHGHTVGVCAVDFSSDGKRLASVGLDNNHEVVLWDWKKGEKLATGRGHKDRVFDIKINPSNSSCLVTVGVRHIKFWTQTGGSFTSVRGIFGSVAKIETMLCIEYGKQQDTCYTGAADGNVYVWVSNRLTRTIPTCKGPCYSIYALDLGFVTGGKDGMVSLWNDSMDHCIKSYSVDKNHIKPSAGGILLHDHPVIRAVALGRAKIIAGTRSGEVLEIDKDGMIDVITQGHSEGEVWGLAMDPTCKSFATVSDDLWLFVWNISETECRAENVFRLPKPARAVAIHPDGKMIAVGYKDGSVSLLSKADFSEIFELHHRKENISDIKFSPSGDHFAVGSHDNFVDIYETSSGKRTGICRGSSSYITHLDWSNDGLLIKTNSGAKELLFFEAPKGVRQAAEPSIIEKNVKWDTWTCVLGSSCLGIWPPKCDLTDVNAASLHPNRSVIATADDFGFVKLFDYPARRKYAKCKSYSGHSAHVTNVRWTRDGSHLVTTGGADTSVLVWKYQIDVGGQSDSSDTDSDEDAGYDSDVEREKNIDYTSKMYTEPLRSRLGEVEQQLADTSKPLVSRSDDERIPVVRLDPKTLPPSKKGKHPVTDVQSLLLEHVFGYRGFDCTNNAYYLPNATSIVFHAAGTGIVQNLATGEQSFYTEHSDDILCLSVCQSPKYTNIVATAQIDLHKPRVHLWDASNMQPVSILLMPHQKGVNCVGFSGSGKLLVTTGMDSDHTICAWKWFDGTLISSEPGHMHKICAIEFRPDSDAEFVSVGIKHVKFWKICGGELVSQKAVLKPSDVKMFTMLSIAFAPDSITYTGCVTGDIYIWYQETLQRVVEKAHDGPIFSMFTTLADGLIVTGGKQRKSTDGACVKLWDQPLTKSRPFPLRGLADVDSLIVKSVCRQNRRILVGSQSCDLIEVDEQTGEAHVLLHSHADGELWGLAVHPTSHIAATASYDRTVRLWNVQTKVMLAKLILDEECACVAFNLDASLLAVGMKNGKFCMISVSDLGIIMKKRDRNCCIHDIKFSPDGIHLAVGYEECVVDIYDITKPRDIRRVHSLKTLQTPIAHLDFASDGKFLKACGYAHEVQIFDITTGHTIKDNSVLHKITWISWNDTAGPEVSGVFLEKEGPGDVNAIDMTHIGHTLATGDDIGFVNLFKFPCTNKQASHRKFRGHSAHVTNVKFTYDDLYLLSTGGDDTCLFVWKCV